MDRTLLGIAAAGAASLLLVGLTFSSSHDAPADFRFANLTEPKTLDPQLMTGQPEGRIAEEIFEGLTRSDPASLSPAPGVAERWDVTPDGKRYTFHLRDDARWTDGHPVTARDFVYSWKRLLDPKLASEYAYILYPIRHAEALNTFDAHADALSTTIRRGLDALRKRRPPVVPTDEWRRFLAANHVNDALRRDTDERLVTLLSKTSGDVSADDLAYFSDALDHAVASLRRGAREARAHFGVDEGLYATDDRTLVVELRAPTPYFLEITSFHATLPTPRWVVENPKRKDDWFLPEHIVSNGPFRLKRWVVNDHIRLERSDSYWGKSEVRLRSIDALSLENETTALNLYLTGEVDWLPQGGYPLDLVDVLKHRPDFHTSPGLSVYFYRINVRKKPFDDRRVREALNLAIDRKTIVEQVLGLGQLPATTFVPAGMKGYTSPESTIRFDVPRAKELLSDAGYPDGKGFPPVGILYNTSQAHKKVAEVVADQLKRNLGISVTAYNQEWQSFLDTVRNEDYSLARAGWVGDYADPNTFLDMWITNGGNNETGFSSPEYDRLIAAAADVNAFVADPERITRGLAGADDLRRAVSEVKATHDLTALTAAQARLRMLLFREAERILIDDELPIIPLYFYVNGNIVNPKVHGFYTNLVQPGPSRGTTSANLEDLHPLRNVWVEGKTP